VTKEQELLQSTWHIALATVNEDGSPHNTPLFFIYNADLTKVYFGSRKDSLHAKNFVRTGKAYAVMFDTAQAVPSGLYIELDNGHEVADGEMSEAMQAHNDIRAKWGKQPLPTDFYPTKYGQTMFVGDVKQIEKYVASKDVDGMYIQEQRVMISAQELV